MILLTFTYQRSFTNDHELHACLFDAWAWGHQIAFAPGNRVGMQLPRYGTLPVRYCFHTMDWLNLWMRPETPTERRVKELLIY